jgi:general secretion pathway protein A
MSYLEHFKLQEPPFRLTPDPDFVYWSKQHSRAKAYMESTIWLADGFVVITGEVGAGKTTLLQTFLGELGDDIVSAVVSQTQLSPTQFLQAVLTEFGFKPFKKRKVELLDMLNMFLIEQYASGKKVVLIIDEAQNLSKRVLEEVRMLSGIETHKEKVLRIILAGQPELRETLDLPSMKQLMQRVRLRFHLSPLDRRELRQYIEHRIAVGGHEEGGLFTDDTFDVIYRYTGGVPRLINTLCDTTLLCAFAEDKKTVDKSDVMSAIDELGWKEPKVPPTSGEYRQISKPVDPPDTRKQLTKIEVRTKGKTVGVHIFSGGRIIAGRSPDNEIFIKSKFVSRHHVQLTSDDSGCTVEDLNSTNGILIGDKRVKKQQLQDGDVVSLGVHELVYTDLRAEEFAAAENRDKKQA